MRAQDIQVGKTYVNRGAGKTRRKVLAIGDEHRPERWLGKPGCPPPNEPGVLFEEGYLQESRLYLSSFAHWCGRAVD